ncbi:phage tail terminator family protein [Brevibacillus dissolubilis]|uniref:phage tail terminator family protein n=1 Tax=Brevibacillus dissolubilis TaxID=1844116 RepID=UPI001115F6C2|nr:hypothetical protein [Brevibacillus dissolubilis]
MKLRDVLQAVSREITALFPGVTVYEETVEQGVKPCFFMVLSPHTVTQESPSMQKKLTTITVTYETDPVSQLAFYDVIDKLNTRFVGTLEISDSDDQNRLRKLRITESKAEIKEGKLNVSFDLTFLERAQAVDDPTSEPMQELTLTM